MEILEQNIFFTLLLFRYLNVTVWELFVYLQNCVNAWKVSLIHIKSVKCLKIATFSKTFFAPKLCICFRNATWCSKIKSIIIKNSNFFICRVKGRWNCNPRPASFRLASTFLELDRACLSGPEPARMSGKKGSGLSCCWALFTASAFALKLYTLYTSNHNKTELISNWSTFWV